MSFLELVKGIRFRQLISLTKFALKHPFFMFATIKATSKTLKIVQEKFPDIHGKDNKANAFRHALWNYLIANNCLKFEKNKTAIISWTKKITDWHEDFSPNKALARAMDLHNNHIGRELFECNEENTEEEIMNELELKLINAVQVLSVNELENNLKNLIFIDHD